MTQDDKSLAQVYQGLAENVRYAYNVKIDKERIETSIADIRALFEARLYNDLLLFFYADSKENYIYAHITNNVILSIAFATSLGLAKEDITDVGLCAFGHDFGMKGYLDLFNKPMQLTRQESRNIQFHPQQSADLFKPYFSDRILNGMRDMHEYVNGKGYPKGKVASEISFLAKIISICDIFEALTHARTFRGEFSPYMALKMIINKKDIMFEKKVVKKFVEFMSIYPVGTLVRLNSGETGLVIGSNPQFPTRSVVRILLNENKEVRPQAKVIDLLDDPMIYISGAIEAKEEKEILHFLKPRGEILI